jgi:hypothetical protein
MEIMSPKLDDNNVVSISIRKHFVTITDELIILIKHNKKCESPCKDIKHILNYLEAELFVAEGYTVNNETK